MDANMMNLCRWNGDTGWPTQLTYYIRSQRPTQKKLQSHNRTCTRSCWSAGTGTPSRGPPLSSSPTCLRTSTSHPSLSIWNRHSRCWWVPRDPRRTTCYTTFWSVSQFKHRLPIMVINWKCPHLFDKECLCDPKSWYPLSAANSQFPFFESLKAIYSQGHRKRDQFTILPCGTRKDNSAPIPNYNNSFNETGWRSKTAPKLPQWSLF